MFPWQQQQNPYDEKIGDLKYDLSQKHQFEQKKRREIQERQMFLDSKLKSLFVTDQFVGEKKIIDNKSDIVKTQGLKQTESNNKLYTKNQNHSSQERNQSFQNQDIQKKLYFDQLKKQMQEKEETKKQQQINEALNDCYLTNYNMINNPFGKDRQKQLQYVQNQLTRPLAFPKEEEIKSQEFYRRTNKNQSIGQYSRINVPNQLSEQYQESQNFSQLPEYRMQDLNNRQFGWNYDQQGGRYNQNQNENGLSESNNIQNQGNDQLQISQSIMQGNQMEQNPQQDNNQSIRQNQNDKQQFFLGTQQMNRTRQTRKGEERVVFDAKNNPVSSDFVSQYDSEYSRILKQEKSLFEKQLNSINDQIMKQFRQQNLPVQQPSSNIQQTVQESEPISKEQQTQNEQPNLQTSEEERLQQLLYLHEQELRKQLEQEQKNEKQLKLQETQGTQTQASNLENAAVQVEDPMALSVQNYLTTLKELSNDVIDLKNNFIHERGRLNYQVIKLRESAQADLESRLKQEKELRQLEERTKASKIWEGERQRQLLQAIEKNQPPVLAKHFELDYKMLYPKLSKVVRFQDQTQGYEYEESQDMFQKSNLIPVSENPVGYSSNLEQLKRNQFINHEDIDDNQDFQYTSSQTRQLKIDDLSKQFYDYKFNSQGRQPEKISNQLTKEIPDRLYPMDTIDAERLLLENDRRIYELNKLNPQEDKEQLNSLSNYQFY